MNVMSWTASEFESLDLADPRCNRRAIRLMEKLSAKPTASIPGTCGDWAHTMGAYRFFSNGEVEWSAILAPQIHNPVTRVSARNVALCIRDITELDFNGQMASGLGPLELRGPAWHVRACRLCRVHLT